MKFGLYNISLEYITGLIPLLSMECCSLPRPFCFGTLFITLFLRLFDSHLSVFAKLSIFNFRKETLIEIVFSASVDDFLQRHVPDNASNMSTGNTLYITLVDGCSFITKSKIKPISVNYDY